MRGLLVACRYLTALPVSPAEGPEDLGRAAGWFPVVGLLLGSLLAVAASGASLLVPPPVAAVLVVALWAGLTGGLHLDGLADTLDGLGGGFSREQALRIMRDPGVGAYGAAGLVLVLLLKVATVGSLPADLQWRAVLVAPALGRLGPLVLVRLCPPARAEGAGHAFGLSVGRGALVVGAAVALLATLGLVGPWGALLLGAALGDAAAFAVYLRRRLGGLTGDCLGALVEGTEAGCLVLLAALAHLGLA